MKGVKAIGGISEIKAGKMVAFYVKAWHSKTPAGDKRLLKWDLYEIKDGKFIKQRTFTEGKLQFSEKQIGKQYLVVGYLYEPELNNASAMKITVVPTEKVQILSVEVLDINGQKITKPLAYGQKIKINVRTTGLQGAKLNVDLWEDDANKGGHNDKNTKVTVASQFVPVGKNGIATTEMLIPLNFKKYAEAQGDKGKESAKHEYYVTAYHDGTQRVASGNVDFTNTKTPEQRKQETRDHLDQKPKRTEPIRGHRGRARKEPPTTPSRNTPAPASPPAQQQPSQPKAVKKEITTVYITDANDKKISGTVKGGIVKVHILSTGLVGRDIRFKFYEEDVTENELVFEQKFKITKDHFVVDVTLNKVSANKGNDYFEGSEQEFFVDIEVLDTHAHIKSAVIDVDVKALKQDIPTNVTKTKVEQQEAGKSQSCGGKYCIKKGDKSELIREINIRLAGFGGNVPTDEFTDRTEKMIKQFQRDYMKVPETGKVCGNVLRAIDDFCNKYAIHFEDTKCKCGKCKGFGNGKFANQKQDTKILELARKYEYPGIHRSLIWAVKASMFYASIIEKDLKYSINCIFSGYRCHEDNKIHKRSSTNHMGKAVDLHINKNGVRTRNISNVDEIRQKVFVKHLGSQIRWDKKNTFSLEPGVNPKYKGEFLATTWIHLDVRQFELKYLEDKFFVKSHSDLNGENLITLAQKTNPNTCKCMGMNSSASQVSQGVSMDKKQENNFTVEDGKSALLKIYKKYGKDIAIAIERMYRDETGHFKSMQYKKCGTGGMESHGKAPYYGWDPDFFESNPKYKPYGLWSAFENKGMSEEGGNKQVTDRKKEFVILPSVTAGMEYKAFYINKHNGNWARWHSTQESAQKNYKKYIEKITPRFVNEFEKNKL